MAEVYSTCYTLHDGQRQNGLDLPRWSSTLVRANPDGNLHLGEAIILLRPAINAYGQRKSCKGVEDHSTKHYDVVHGVGLVLWAWKTR